MTMWMSLVVVLLVVLGSEVAAASGRGATKEEARRTVCRYHTEKECTSNGCSWCLGVCRKVRGGANCKKEEDAMGKFEEELQRVLGGGEGRGAQQERGASEVLGRRRRRRAGRAAVRGGARTAGRRGMSAQWLGIGTTMALHLTQSQCRGFYSGTVESTCVAHASKYASLDTTECGAQCVIATAQCKRVPGLSTGTCKKIGRYVGQFSVLQELEKADEKNTPAPATPAPPSSTCDSTACQVVEKACKVFLSGDAETVCIAVAPYVTSYTAWKTIKTVALELWDLLKDDGSLSAADVFRVVMSALESSGGIAFFEDLYDKMIEQVTILYNRLVALGELVISLVKAIPVFLQGIFGALARMSMGGGNIERTCWQCADEFEMLSKALGLDDPCTKAITAAMWATYQAWSSAYPEYFAFSTYTAVSYSQCSAINSFICSDIGCSAFAG